MIALYDRSGQPIEIERTAFVGFIEKDQVRTFIYLYSVHIYIYIYLSILPTAVPLPTASKAYISLHVYR